MSRLQIPIHLCLYHFIQPSIEKMLFVVANKNRSLPSDVADEVLEATIEHLQCLRERLAEGNVRDTLNDEYLDNQYHKDLHELFV